MITSKPNQPYSAQQERLLRLPEVLARFPVSRSSWWAGVSVGRFPRPVRISSRSVAWRESDINLLIQACELATDGPSPKEACPRVMHRGLPQIGQLDLFADTCEIPQLPQPNI